MANHMQASCTHRLTSSILTIAKRYMKNVFTCIYRWKSYLNEHGRRVWRKMELSSLSFSGAIRLRICNTVMDLHGACAETVLALPGGFQTVAGHLAGHEPSNHK